MFTNVPQEIGPNGYQAPGGNLFAPAFWGYGNGSSYPGAISTGRVMVGIGTTALGSLRMLQEGATVSHVIWDSFAPIR